MSIMVNIEGLSKADVLAALFNASAPIGMGLMQASNGPQVMDRLYAQELLDLGSAASGDYPKGTEIMSSSALYFDYLYGRPLKLDLSSDIEFNPKGFDRINGGDGSAQRVIDALRESSELNSLVTQELHDTNMEDSILDTAITVETLGFDVAGPLAMALICEVKRPEMTVDDLPTPPPFESGREHLNWSADQALKYFDTDLDKLIAIFITLVKQHPATAWITTHPLTPIVVTSAIGLTSRADMEYMLKGFAA